MIKVRPQNNADINGILHKFPILTATCSSKSFQIPPSKCTNAINISYPSHFCSGTETDQWFIFSVPNIKLFATHYVLQMPSRESNDYWYYPVSWDFYGTTKTGEEKHIDHVDKSELTPNNRIRTYELNIKGYYSQFKLKMIGTNDGGYNDLRIYKIDLFGTIYSFLPFRMIQKGNYYHFSLCFIFVLLSVL